MKLRIGIDKAKREAWHRWFAWYPVCVGSHDWRWLEVVESKGEYRDWGMAGAAGWVYEKRAIQ